MKDHNFLNANNAEHLWHPMAHPADSLANRPKIIMEAEGVYITDIDGNKVLDAIGGLWNVNLGFSCDEIKQAITDQLAKLPYYSIFRGSSNEAVIELSYQLKEFFAPDGLVRSFFTSGGSDGVEIALRLARQYHKIRGESGKVKFLSLKKGYHGTHMGGASVNGNSNFRTQYEPLLHGCYHIPSPYTYRNPFNETDPEKLALLCAQALKDEIQFQNAETIAAMIMEPVLGAGGVIPAHPSFMPIISKICKEHNILLISDEVITAYGRAGAWSGARLFGVKPDMMVTAKAITNGYFPFGAVMINQTIAETFEQDKSGKATISSGYTYSGHPVGAAAALASLRVMQEQEIYKNAKIRGQQLHQGLLDLAKQYPIIGDVRGGYGLMCALELVSDKEHKTPIDKETIAKIHEATYQAGVMVRASGANIILSPPLIVTEADIDKILNALDTAFQRFDA
ncbi:MAG: aminotransferase class III-fold pyridoxal phosphate-dependent enzyme [Alphaproteobacteria bacterium]|nr:aminotransferase class III-fold pyridoxal phosphate-dependent enzyme [Alphaproteobacteria bacterium]